MRLIDADAVKADIEKFNRPLCDGYHMKDYALNQIITDIESQPTVKAITVEWIEEWGWKNGMSESMSLRVMIDDWEKENEERTNA